MKNKKFYHDSPQDAYNGSNNVVRHFDSLEALCNAPRNPNYNMFNSQYGMDDTITITRNGDESLVPQAEKLIAQLEANVESVGAVWQADVMGSVLSIPAYLANVPTPFRRMKNVVSDVSPVRIFVGIVCSAVISVEDMKKRGIAIMALVMRLQMSRPVEVILYSETEAGSKDSFLTIRLESKPISLAHCINALANVYVARHITYAIHSVDGFSSGWPRGYSDGKPTKAYQVWRKGILGITDQDILLESTYYTDLILTNPLKWINDNLALYSVTED